MMKEYVLLHMIALTGGTFLDLLIGDPHGIPHPVVAIGRLISFLEKHLYGENGEDGDKLRRGFAACLTVLAVTGVLTGSVLILAYRAHLCLGVFVEAVLTCYILAAKSLSTESMRVHDALLAEDKPKARSCLAMIVGRDVERLDKEGIIRAAVETVAENTSDGVIAPLIYTALGGPVPGMLYKAVNTMDSMIGYQNERYAYYGRTAAKLDDLVNFLPSRISALLMVFSAAILGGADPAYQASRALRIWKRDRRNHLSPNSAQTESACAGALGIRLGGESYYGGVAVRKPYIGDALRQIETADIQRAGKLMFVSEGIAFILAVSLWLLFFVQ